MNLRVAAAQMRFDKSLQENIQTIYLLLETCADDKVDAVLFPECALSSYDMEYIHTLSAQNIRRGVDKVCGACSRHRIWTILGTPQHIDGKLYNSALVIDEHGRVIHRYSKVQLTGDEARIFTPGNSLSLFKIKGITGGMFICHDWRYPELGRIPVMLGAKVLFHPSAGADSPTSLAWKSLVESKGSYPAQNDVYYIFTNAVGQSRDGKRLCEGGACVLDPHGLVIAEARRGEEVIAATLNIKAATGQWAKRSLASPAHLKSHWEAMLEATLKRIAEEDEILAREYS